MSLSVVINTKNAAETLGQTLESVQSLADEIVIVDMKSSDDTLAIAEKFTEHIFHYEQDLGFADPARNFALSKATGDWILVLDADEEIMPELGDWMKKMSSDAVGKTDSADAYFLPRKNITFNKWIQKTGWWPDYQLRFFKNGAVQWTDKVHTSAQAKGKTVYLPAEEKYAIVHHNYSSVVQFLEKLNRYTSLEDRSKEKKDFTTSAAFDVFSSEFFRRFFVSKGIDEGMHGLNLSLLQSFYELVVYQKAWNLQKFPATQNDQKMTFQTLRQFQRDLNYWIADWYCQNTSGFSQVIWKVRRKLKV